MNTFYVFNHFNRIFRFRTNKFRLYIYNFKKTQIKGEIVHDVFGIQSHLKRNYQIKISMFKLIKPVLLQYA